MNLTELYARYVAFMARELPTRKVLSFADWKTRRTEDQSYVDFHEREEYRHCGI